MLQKKKGYTTRDKLNILHLQNNIKKMGIFSSPKHTQTEIQLLLIQQQLSNHHPS